ncbi:MAG: thermonuclease family protein [Rhodoferax sp.]|uniref:thermonuclease family protein n=1 Tax=Rhodoferax sp. TaxID=50421 RepID=UPI00140067A1|nr:thermonuclease family protein [Rhodoferax sp.]NDP37554.1 thermonuclease family protein [Rhodoferax sp.]
MHRTFLRQGLTRPFHFFLLVAIFLAASSAQAKSVFAGRVSHVSDGDTLWVRPGAGGPPRKLRIDGIDAPEICQTGGQVAREVLAQRVLHRHVEVTIRRHDDYGRGLARIQIDEHDLGRQMVQAGQAWSYRWRRDLGPYAAEEALARQSRLGLFAADAAELPRDFRRRHGSCHAASR